MTAGFTNTVVITTTTPGDDPINNEDDHPVDVQPDVEIWVEKTGSASPVTPGEPMTYSLTVTNDGPSDAENVVVTDTLPAEVTFDSAAIRHRTARSVGLGPGHADAGRTPRHPSSPSP